MEFKRSDCPVACVLDIVGDRWTLLIVRDLLLGKCYFDDFLTSPEKIATNILTSRLQQLVKAGFLKKQADGKDRRRFRYELTEQGAALRKLVRGFTKWGLKNLQGTKALGELRKD